MYVFLSAIAAPAAREDRWEGTEQAGVREGRKERGQFFCHWPAQLPKSRVGLGGLGRWSVGWEE